MNNGLSNVRRNSGLKGSLCFPKEQKSLDRKSKKLK